VAAILNMARPLSSPIGTQPIMELEQNPVSLISCPELKNKTILHHVLTQGNRRFAGMRNT
jgi:hypothetical protein